MADEILSINYQPSNSAVYYTPPRQFDTWRTIKAMRGAVPGVIIGGIIYSLILPHIGILSLRVVAVICAALVTGLLSRAVVKYGRICTPLFGVLVGVFLGLLALYVMWVAWVYEYLQLMNGGFSLWFLISNPIRFMRIVHVLMVVGTMTYRNDVIKGVPLLICWLIEAGAILGASVIFAVKSVGLSQVICPQCGAICKQACRPARFAVNRQDEMIAAVLSRDFTSLATHPARRHDDDPELALRLESCMACQKTHVLTVSRIAWGRVNGKLTVVSQPLVKQMLVSLEEAEKLKTLSPDSGTQNRVAAPEQTQS